MPSFPDAPRAALRSALVTIVALLALVGAVANADAAPDVQITPSTGLVSGSAVTATANAPIQLVGPVTQATSVRWDPANAVLTGAATAPAGWTPEYTVDGTTWSASLPASPASVVGVRASGPVESDGVSSGRQAVTTVNSASSVTPAPSFPSAGGGDGYDIFASSRYILTAIHHSADYGGGMSIDCWERATGSACSPARYTKAGYQTSFASPGVVIDDKAYVFVMKSGYLGYGVVCTDVSAVPFTDCGYTELVPYSANTFNPPNVFLGTIARSGTKIYGGIHTGYSGVSNWVSLACFDTATNAPCAGQPYLNAAQTPQPGPNPANYGNVQSAGSSSASTLTSAFADRVFIAGRELWCVNAADGTPCTGWGTAGSPTSVALTGSSPINPVPMRDTSGAITGVCVLAQGGGSAMCRNLDQTAATVPSGLSTMITASPLSNGGLQSYAYNDTRQYWLRPSGANAFPVCYDWTTDAACAGFGSTTPQAERYTLTLDPFDPDCGFTYGNNAVVTTFNTRTGGSVCAGGPKMTLTAQASVPRLGCSPDSAIQAWGTIKVTPPGGVAVTGFRVTVRDSSGLPIPGYSDRVPNAQGIVDVSSLSPSASGQSPTITVEAVGATVAEANATTIAVTRQTDFPQLCLPLEARASCAAALPGSFPGGLVGLAPLLVTGEVTETPSSGPAQVFPLSGTAARTSIPGCLGGLGGTVTFTDGKPAAGKTVTLRAPDGTVVATTTTGSTGAYSFPADLGPAGYSVTVDAVTRTGDVQAGATAMVDFVLPLPPPISPPSLPVQASATREGVSRGVIELVVTVPGPGSVSVVGTTALAGSSIRACTARRAVSRAGKVRVACRLTRPVRTLACRRPVKVTVRTTFTARSGSVSTGRSQVVMPRIRCAAPPVTG